MAATDGPEYQKQMPSTPADFPRDLAGSVAGVQPKLLAQFSNEKYVVGAIEAEQYAKYEKCFDLVNQLQDYVVRKRSEHPEWTVDELLRKLCIGVARRSDWDCTPGEQQWILKQLCSRMDWGVPGGILDLAGLQSTAIELMTNDQTVIDRLLGLTYTEDGYLIVSEHTIETSIQKVMRRLHPDKPTVPRVTFKVPKQPK